MKHRERRAMETPLRPDLGPLRAGVPEDRRALPRAPPAGPARAAAPQHVRRVLPVPGLPPRAAHAELRELPMLITNNETYFFREAHQFRCSPRPVCRSWRPSCDIVPCASSRPAAPRATSSIRSSSRLRSGRATRPAATGWSTRATSAVVGCCRPARPATPQPPAGLRRGHALDLLRALQRPFRPAHPHRRMCFFELNLVAPDWSARAPPTTSSSAGTSSSISPTRPSTPPSPAFTGRSRTTATCSWATPNRSSGGATTFTRCAQGQHRLRESARGSIDDPGVRRRRLAVHPQGAEPGAGAASGLHAGRLGRLGDGRRSSADTHRPAPHRDPGRRDAGHGRPDDAEGADAPGTPDCRW